MEETIIGISPGTRTMGIAVLRGNYLKDWRVKPYGGKWSAAKLRTIVGAIGAKITDHGVIRIAIKAPHARRSSRGLNQLIMAIEKLAQKHYISVTKFTIEELKAHCSMGEKGSKYILMEYVLPKYDQLNWWYQKEKRNLNAYYIKVFEAVAIAHLASLNNIVVD